MSVEHDTDTDGTSEVSGLDRVRAPAAAGALDVGRVATVGVAAEAVPVVPEGARTAEQIGAALVRISRRGLKSRPRRHYVK